MNGISRLYFLLTHLLRRFHQVTLVPVLEGDFVPPMETGWSSVDVSLHFAYVSTQCMQLHKSLQYRMPLQLEQ